MTVATRIMTVPWVAALVRVIPIPLRVVRPFLLVDNAKENRAGSWGRLRSTAERARYTAVQEMTETYAADGFVLDIGCSQGILQEGLTYRRYLGIDRSPGAISLAQAKTDDRTEFLVGDARSYRPDDAPDAVVLNEVVYYLKDPAGVVEHYVDLITDRGVVVVSVYAHTWSNRRLLRELGTRLTLVEARSARSGRLAWTVAAYRARRPVRPG